MENQRTSAAGSLTGQAIPVALRAAYGTSKRANGQTAAWPASVRHARVTVGSAAFDAGRVLAMIASWRWRSGLRCSGWWASRGWRGGSVAVSHGAERGLPGMRTFPWRWLVAAGFSEVTCQWSSEPPVGVVSWRTTA